VRVRRSALIGGVVLAAGEGRRFGDRKQLAELDGRPLLEHAIGAMLAVPALERVVVVLGAGAEEIAGRVELGRAEVVVCEGWDEGIAASLRAGVDALADAQAVVVTLGDQPLVTPQAIAAVLDEFNAPAPAARATYGGRPGHPVLIKRELFDGVRRLRGDAGARDFLVATGVREVECGRLSRPDDVDTREDLRAVRERIADAPRPASA
jgi:molybdenum cofactor cytidylyltransferase